MDADLWRERVAADITLLRDADVRPRAIVLRLEEILQEPTRPNSYPGFSSCGRGISFFDLDRGRYVITLEFRHSDRAAPAVGALESLKERFQAIEEVTFHRYGEKPYKGALTITLMPREQAS